MLALTPAPAIGVAIAVGTLAGLLAAGCRRPATHPAEVPPARAAAPAKPAPPPPRGKQITIVYSSNLLGEYEPCG